MVDLASLSPSSSHPTLLFYTFGDASKFLTNAASKLESKRKKDAFLFDFFKPYYGSYTNFQVGLENGDSDVEVLREGLPGAGLWLAGEHTAPFVALGTATGAYWSGESVGRRIAEHYGFTRNKKPID